MKTKTTRDGEGDYGVHVKRGHRYVQVGVVSRVRSSKWSWNAGGARTGFGKTKKEAVDKLLATVEVE